MLAFGRDILTEFTVTDFKLRFILHFSENFNLKVNIDSGKGSNKILVFFCTPCIFCNDIFCSCKKFLY